MRQVRIENSFASWRVAARSLLAAGLAPDELIWNDGTGEVLEWASALDQPDEAGEVATVRVPEAFVSLAERVACHRDSQKWNLLYRLLYRQSIGGESGLMQNAVDDDVYLANRMRQQVGRDLHRMHAFVRFRAVEGDQQRPHYIAWHRPDHYIVPLAAPFFRDRFRSMLWSILTPDESVHWDGSKLVFGPGAPRSAAPADDELESLWRTYYGNIFNPARINPKVMTQNVPRRYWEAMPEMADIDALLEAAPKRLEAMMMANKQTPPGCENTGSAADFIPSGALSLTILREAAAGCRGCELYCHATQTVFGEGPTSSGVMFIGEQPGDNEDRAGRPFVGPAGQLLDEVLEEVGIDRSKLYLTNAVKHFKFEPRGTRRIHAKPTAREIHACEPWLEAEAKLIQPQVMVCLGATAGQALFGPAFRITKQRGQPLKHPWSAWTMATFHPSALLRIPDPSRRDEARAQFTSDLKQVAQAIARL